MQEISTYKKYFKSLFDFMVKKGCVKLPYPKIILNNTEQEDTPFIKTAYFDPGKDAIVIYTYNRALKDQMRSLAHEIIHYGQRQNGSIEKSGYSSDKITQDKNLIHLEAEAYLKGNMIFRAWTETVNRQN